MQYFATVQSIAASAHQTLAILDRQARKDAQKTAHATYAVYCFLTSPAAVLRYRIMWKITKELAVILTMICIAIWTTIQEQSDRLVESCLEEPVEPGSEPETPESSLTEAEATAIAVECGLVPVASVARVQKVRKSGRSIKQGFSVPAPKLA